MIFDSCTHPTIDGTWISPLVVSSFQRLSELLGEAGVDRACAIGLPGVGGYTHQGYIDACRDYPHLTPVAGISQSDLSAEKIRELRERGFQAIKLHPRFGSFSYGDERLLEVSNAAGDLRLPIFLCTHQFNSIEPWHQVFSQIVKLIHSSPASQFVLMHGGGPSLLDYLDLARRYSNVLIDLSFTLLKYTGSSLDLDLAYALRNLDRRICVGTDFPDFSPLQMRNRINELALELSDEKRVNFLWGNLASLF